MIAKIEIKQITHNKPDFNNYLSFPSQCTPANMWEQLLVLIYLLDS